MHLQYLLLLLLGCSVCNWAPVEAGNPALIDAMTQTCGVSRIMGGAIVGGVVAGDSEFPWMVSLQLSVNGQQKHFCGGAIIAQQWIVTAAHCFKIIVQKHALSRVSAYVGVNQLTDTTGDRYELDHVLVHDGFDLVNFHNDIALVRTRVPINFRRSASRYRVNAICLPPYSTRTLAFPPPYATVAGWGTLFSGSREASNKLMKVTVSLDDKAQCAALYKKSHGVTMSSYAVCYGQEGKDSCQGDSGGPLQVQVSGRTYSVGVVSFGAGCGSFPGVYTNVGAYTDWIEANVY